MIDFTKPVQTRDGQHVRLLTTDMKGARDSIVGLIQYDDGEETSASWQANGRFMANGTCETDLINVPEKRVMWVNIYDDWAAGTVTKDRADGNASHTRKALVRVEYEVGQFDEEPGA